MDITAQERAAGVKGLVELKQHSAEVDRRWLANEMARLEKAGQEYARAVAEIEAELLQRMLGTAIGLVETVTARLETPERRAELAGSVEARIERIGDAAQRLSRVATGWAAKPEQTDAAA